MPWTAGDAKGKTKKATSGRLASLWAEVANSALSRTGNDASAIRQANAVVKRQRGRGTPRGR